MSEQQVVVPVGITVNGEDHEFAVAPTVAQLLETLNLPTKGIAVAVNGAVFPKARWDEVVDRGWDIEILTAVQGG
ncbi:MULTISPECIES: sulfur carrier protein ThiS [Rhodococcus]|jgi:sulfur carrier protein|uniref:Sulfur carrier protein ThiS n=1 Tax=Rhodococcus oxybenzonivorans TaxID=1990687 RepID=A0AAE4UY65_9NOCA|nr:MULTISPECIES: sulfur carrier protein ThiS [Rhodococcus]MDV7240630.1 sulfur carrier protein ThiS [Rhodococcus oxybenzonivorans]MDV7265228.1 sulfur carrier protein ThiS [Rhodococcus oxybenzonivorans]MDV7272903.1 sulfur carrier protein ThiS [Rhodococcus oxybenzonivorans]MDV7333358.1 sulfur carrier protein ThiS [Rhodococcus oxybenzonivorans]MDV7342525.1 sulfur carrier protein ThiS [Rhodococcus oxybenzonivorans]